MNPSRQIAAELTLCWESDDAAHSERFFLPKLNLWRDYIPFEMEDALKQAAVGESVVRRFDAGELLEPYDKTQVHEPCANRFVREFRGQRLTPRPGRFFPRTLVPGVGETFDGDMRPMRVLAADDERLRIDFNHPLARRPLELEIRVVEELPAAAERGGRCNDIPQLVAGDGPGMQARLAERETDFFADDALGRMDPRDDAEFYREARLVPHLDAEALAQLAAIHGRLLQPGMAVLDLMSSWQSHLPGDGAGLEVTGLGMNREELEANPALGAGVVHDLNRDPALPFDAGAFDAVICSASVEYLTDPAAVCAEVSRVLKPGAPFVVTFSDRFFPTKAVNVWQELHPFERMGLVLALLRGDGRFTDLHTESVRNYPRPEDDKYFGQLFTADPIFAVWGRRV